MKYVSFCESSARVHVGFLQVLLLKYMLMVFF